MQQVILLSPPFQQIDTFLSPSATSFPPRFDGVTHPCDGHVRSSLSFLKRIPPLSLTSEIQRFPSFATSRSGDPFFPPPAAVSPRAPLALLSLIRARACAAHALKCYRAQLVLRVRQERAALSSSSLQPRVSFCTTTRAALPASWLSSYTPSSSCFSRSLYAPYSSASFSIEPCATRAARAPPTTYFLLLFPFFITSIALRQLLPPGTQQFLSSFCSCFSVLSISFYRVFLLRQIYGRQLVQRVCHDKKSCAPSPSAALSAPFCYYLLSAPLG